MAEFIFGDLVKKANLEAPFQIESAAVSREELGNPVYPPGEAGACCAWDFLRVSPGKADYKGGLCRL